MDIKFPVLVVCFGQLLGQTIVGGWSPVTTCQAPPSMASPFDLISSCTQLFTGLSSAASAGQLQFIYGKTQVVNGQNYLAIFSQSQTSSTVYIGIIATINFQSQVTITNLVLGPSLSQIFAGLGMPQDSISTINCQIGGVIYQNSNNGVIDFSYYNSGVISNGQGNFYGGSKSNSHGFNGVIPNGQGWSQGVISNGQFNSQSGHSGKNSGSAGYQNYQGNYGGFQGKDDKNGNKNSSGPQWQNQNSKDNSGNNSNSWSMGSGVIPSSYSWTKSGQLNNWGSSNSFGNFPGVISNSKSNSNFSGNLGNNFGNGQIAPKKH